MDNSTLSTLPAELRNRIYEYVLTSADTITIRRGRNADQPIFPALSTTMDASALGAFARYDLIHRNEDDKMSLPTTINPALMSSFARKPQTKVTVDWVARMRSNRFHQQRYRRPTPLSLAHTCREIRNETLQIAYAQNTFALVPKAGETGCDALRSWRRDIGEENYRLISKIIIRYTEEWLRQYENGSTEFQRLRILNGLSNDMLQLQYLDEWEERGRIFMAVPTYPGPCSPYAELDVRGNEDFVQSLTELIYDGWCWSRIHVPRIPARIRIRTPSYEG